MADFKKYFDLDEYVTKDKVRQYLNLTENALFRSVLETASEKSGEKLINVIYYLLRWFKNKHGKCRRVYTHFYSCYCYLVKVKVILMFKKKTTLS